MSTSNTDTTDNTAAADPAGSDATVTPNAEKDPSQWVTGGEPMTGPQGSYVNTLAQEAGEDVPDHMTKAEASQLIDELQTKTGRG